MTKFTKAFGSVFRDSRFHNNTDLRARTTKCLFAIKKLFLKTSYTEGHAVKFLIS